MRTMCYRREIDREDGYFIANVGTVSWDALPTPANKKGPAIRVSNAALENGRIAADVADYARLNEFTEDEYASPEFRENYIKALRGELEGWKLVGINICPGGCPCLIFVSDDFDGCEMLYIERAPWLQVVFEVDREDGGTDKYLLKMSDEGNGRYFMSVVEYYEHGTTETIFEGGYRKIPECPDKGWYYAYVIESR